MGGRLDYLRNRFGHGYVYLVYAGGVAKLAKEAEMLDMNDGPIFMVHLAKQLDDFEAHFGDSAEFLPQQIQSMAGITYRQLNTWVERKLFLPIENDQRRSRIFGAYDAFMARVLGQFRMNGASVQVLEKIVRFLSENPEPEPAT
ncbi:MAG: hypothetical protein DWQ31_17190 [Planctomycetota bacterium]|nr:MAG: hypothetical protein DWQ31_17190 [Planctomycetota bacterium]REJ92088.1 MAG: hypothetical protein DWQ35_13140 [Planctomycetota bacterium]REK28624.1 MAG: hypothetical protein DWQ42_04730 [Planctomycetota bacterium]REK39238.1 MAG: hypothetical protein DWQ46_18310 [Planctomycetota bacterium]